MMCTHLNDSTIDYAFFQFADIAFHETAGTIVVFVVKHQSPAVSLGPQFDQQRLAKQPKLFVEHSIARRFSLVIRSCTLESLIAASIAPAATPAPAMATVHANFLKK